MGGFAVLDLGIDLTIWPWVWLAIAVVFALVELTVLAGTFVLLPFAVSAFIASIIGFYDAPVEVQWAVFLVGGGLLFAVAWKLVRRYLGTSVKPLGVGADRLVGMNGVVMVAVAPGDTDRRGRVSVAGEVWGALTDRPEPIAEGSTVRITSMRGTRVVVQPLVSDVAARGEDPA